MHTLIVPVVLVGMFGLIITLFLTAVVLLIVHSIRSSRRGTLSPLPPANLDPLFRSGMQSAPPTMDNPILPMMMDAGAAEPAVQAHPNMDHGHHGQENHHGHMASPDAGSFGGGHHGGGFDSGAGSFSGGDGGGGHSH